MLQQTLPSIPPSAADVHLPSFHHGTAQMDLMGVMDLPREITLISLQLYGSRYCMILTSE